MHTLRMYLKSAISDSVRYMFVGLTAIPLIGVIVKEWKPTHTS